MLAKTLTNKLALTKGVDVGIGITATRSDGTVVGHPKPLAGALKGLLWVDRAIARSRNVYGWNDHSTRWQQRYSRRRRLHAQVASVRNDDQYKNTRR